MSLSLRLDAAGSEDLDTAADPAVVPLDIVASTQPSVVLTSLMQVCVPRVCDELIIEVNDDGAERCLVRPRSMLPTSSLPARHTLVVSFDEDAGEHDHAVFAGVATFVWHERVPSSAEQHLAAALLDIALLTMQRQRAERRALDAEAHVDNLRIGLQTNRLIGNAVGILMSLHKITDKQAFDILDRTSQHLNRKVRDIAVDVIETGWLDPQLQPSTSPARHLNFASTSTSARSSADRARAPRQSTPPCSDRAGA